MALFGGVGSSKYDGDDSTDAIMRYQYRNQLKKLIDAIDKFVSDGPRVLYLGDDDSVGVFGCCGNQSFCDHDEDCGWVTMKQSAEQAKITLAR